MWRNFLATFLLQSLRYVFSRSRENKPGGITLDVPAETNPKAVLPNRADHPVMGGPHLMWLEMPHYLSYEMLDRATRRLGDEDWGKKLQALQHLVDAEEGDLSLRWAIGIESDRAASLLRNAGILLRPGAGASIAGSDYPDNITGSP